MARSGHGASYLVHFKTQNNYPREKKTCDTTIG